MIVVTSTIIIVSVHAQKAVLQGHLKLAVVAERQDAGLYIRVFIGQLLVPGSVDGSLASPRILMATQA